MRQRTRVAAAIGVVAALAVAGALGWHYYVRPPQRAVNTSATHARPGRSVPPGAVSAVRRLVSATGRQALTPELSAVTGTGRLFPAGTTFTAQPGSWHQAGAYANVHGTLRVPSRAPVRVEVGLVRRGARWLVTFESPAR
ncbi:MAG: hypothetical protein ACRDPO_14650 [Streptosporangiaceae bacterium]